MKKLPRSTETRGLMGRARRMLIIGDDAPRGVALAHALNERGFDCAHAGFDASGLLGDGARPDAVILDMSGGQTADAQPRHLEFIARLGDGDISARPPVILVGDRARFADTGIDEIMPPPVSFTQVSARIMSLLRLDTMHRELRRRCATAAAYGINVPGTIAPPASVGDAELLVLGVSPDYPLIQHALTGNGSLTGALTPANAFGYLMGRDFDALIIDLNCAPKPFFDLARSVRNTPELYNLPILMLAPPELVGEPEAAFASGVTALVFKPLDGDDLRARTMALVREMRFRDAVRDAYGQLRPMIAGMAARDRLTGLYSKDFLVVHLRAMLADASRHGAAMSLALFEIVNIGDLIRQYGHVAGDRVIAQAGEMMAMLMRGEDLAAREAGPRLAVALPDTAGACAAIAARRVAGVVNYTEFSIPCIGEPVRIELACGIAGFEQGDTPETLIERARAGIAGGATLAPGAPGAPGRRRQI